MAKKKYPIYDTKPQARRRASTVKNRRNHRKSRQELQSLKGTRNFETFSVTDEKEEPRVIQSLVQEREKLVAKGDLEKAIKVQSKLVFLSDRCRKDTFQKKHGHVPDILSSKRWKNLPTWEQSEIGKVFKNSRAAAKTVKKSKHLREREEKASLMYNATTASSLRRAAYNRSLTLDKTDKEVCFSELKRIRKQMHNRMLTVGDWFGDMETMSNDKISLPEFVEGLQKNHFIRPKVTERQARELFSYFDIDDSGFLPWKEVYDILEEEHGKVTRDNLSSHTDKPNFQQWCHSVFIERDKDVFESARIQTKEKFLVEDEKKMFHYLFSKKGHVFEKKKVELKVDRRKAPKPGTGECERRKKMAELRRKHLREKKPQWSGRYDSNGRRISYEAWRAAASLDGARRHHKLSKELKRFDYGQDETSHDAIVELKNKVNANDWAGATQEGQYLAARIHNRMREVSKGGKLKWPEITGADPDGFKMRVTAKQFHDAICTLDIGDFSGAEFWSLFDHLDTDGDGALSWSQVTKFFDLYCNGPDFVPEKEKKDDDSFITSHHSLQAEVESEFAHTKSDGKTSKQRGSFFGTYSQEDLKVARENNERYPKHILKSRAPGQHVWAKSTRVHRERALQVSVSKEKEKAILISKRLEPLRYFMFGYLMWATERRVWTKYLEKQNITSSRPTDFRTEMRRMIEHGKQLKHAGVVELPDPGNVSDETLQTLFVYFDVMNTKEVDWKEINKSLEVEFAGGAEERNAELLKDIRKSLDMRNMSNKEFWESFDSPGGLEFPQFCETLKTIGTWRKHPTHFEYIMLFREIDRSGNDIITAEEMMYAIGTDRMTRLNAKHAKERETEQREAELQRLEGLQGGFTTDVNMLRKLGANEKAIETYMEGLTKEAAENSGKYNPAPELMMRLLKKMAVSNLSERGLWESFGKISRYDRIYWPEFKRTMLHTFDRPIPTDIDLNHLFDWFQFSFPKKDYIVWNEVVARLRRGQKRLDEASDVALRMAEEEERLRQKRIEEDKEKIRKQVRVKSTDRHGFQKAKHVNSARAVTPQWTNRFVNERKKQTDPEIRMNVIHNKVHELMILEACESNVVRMRKERKLV
eukprot:g590.t1